MISQLELLRPVVVAEVSMLTLVSLEAKRGLVR